ncbi:MAG: apolipoprotein N-acyltransferase [Rhodobacteraceae bacterium]|nr:apolipoprotein N-acyltransferase [Paracoccaceae bacterium]
MDTAPGQRRAAYTGWRGVVLALVAGAGIGTGQAPLAQPLIALGFLVLALHLFLQANTARRAAKLGWLIGTAFFSSTLFWIVEPFLVDAPRHGWMAPFALILMAGGLALFWAAAFALAAVIARGRIGRLVALVAALGLAEYLRAHLFTGFPWNMLAYVWVDTPVMQAAAVLGPHGLTLLTLALAALPLALRRCMAGLVAASVLLAILWAGGSYRLGQPVPAPSQATTLRLIQPNAPQHQKWDPDFIPIFLRRQMEMTAAPAAIRPDLVIWPEAAVPWWLDHEPDLQARISAAAAGGTVIIGARRLERGRIYNSLAVLGPDGQSQAVYDKAHLVPFGEYIPFGGLLSRLGLHGLAAEEGGGFSAGPGPKPIDLGPAGKALPLICYEAIFPGMSAFAAPRPDWLLQITNDAWFGTLAGPQQHLAQARARAVEQGLPLVRVANTGISAVIDARGRVTDALPLGEAGFLDAVLPGRTAPTPYHRSGDLPVLALMLIGLVSPVIGRRRKY